jgi:hypothetical protein
MAEHDQYELPRCFYCGGPIRVEPQVVRGRTYHPPGMVNGTPGKSCAQREWPLRADDGRRPKRPVADQLDLLSDA